jgi:calcineurin-like phosphoesterase
MTGPLGGVIGTEAEPVLKRFITRMPARFKPAKGPGIFSAVVITIDRATGRASAIERLQLREEEP